MGIEKSVTPANGDSKEVGVVKTSKIISSTVGGTAVPKKRFGQKRQPIANIKKPRPVLDSPSLPAFEYGMRRNAKIEKKN
jgi:hypothetical protein